MGQLLKFNTENEDHRFGKQHRFKKNIAMVMTAFYVSLFMIGVSGNFLTCLIIFMNSYMRTPPNYYLFNLAVTDILTQSIGKDLTLLGLGLIKINTVLANFNNPRPSLY